MFVLLLENDPDERRLLRIVLESRGHTVAFEGGAGHVGIQWLARGNRVDVVLSALRLPIACGLDVLAAVRSLGSRQGSAPRVVLASRHWTEEEVALARDLGAALVVAKPLSLETLALRLEALVAAAPEASPTGQSLTKTEV